MEWWNDFVDWLTKSNPSGGRDVKVRIENVSPSAGLATEATQQQVLAAVQDIEINAENINLNTDELETKIDETNNILNDQTTQLNNIEVALGDPPDAAATTDTGTFSLISLFKRSLQHLSSLLGITSTAANQVIINDSIENLLYTFNGTFDAFYRQRFSEPATLFDSKQISDKQPLFWDDQLVSGAGGASTYNSNQASTTLSVSNVTAAVRVRQTFRRFNYQPGKSQLIIQTGIFGAPGTGIKRKAGYFDARNGLFFDQQSDGMGVTTRTFTSGVAVDTRVLQSNWNLDKMDGAGTSGVTLDFTKGQVWFIDFEWLGTGDVAFGFFVGRKPIYCHVFYNANVQSLVWMSTPNLPLRYEIENTGTGAAVGFTQICSTVISEGGLQLTGFPFGVTRGNTALQTNNDANIYPLIAMRLNSNYLGSSIELGDFNISCTSTSTYNYYLILNPTVVGTALAFTAVTNSSLDVQVNTVNTTTVTGGTILHVGTTTQTNEGNVSDLLNTDFRLGSSIAGVADIVVLAVQRVTGTTETFYASQNWRDQQ